jgi:hypothetical protein
MKALIKQFFRILGLEASRYHSFNLAPAQLAKTLKLVDINVIFDVGVNDGQFARKMRQHGYRGKIISFEPLTSARISICEIL